MKYTDDNTDWDLDDELMNSYSNIKELDIGKFYSKKALEAKNIIINNVIGVIAAGVFIIDNKEYIEWYTEKEGGHSRSVDEIINGNLSRQDVFPELVPSFKKKKCANCDIELKSRIDAKFCSDKCKMKLHRLIKKHELKENKTSGIKVTGNALRRKNETIEDHLIRIEKEWPYLLEFYKNQYGK